MASRSSSSSASSSQEVTEHNRQLLKELKKGDLVEFPRGGYSHWGVYVGNGKVVHVTMVDDAGSFQLSNPGHLASPSGVRYSKGVVKKEDLLNVAGNSKAEKNNGKDKVYKPLSPDTIVSNALKLVGTDVDYNALEENCEHFASLCRYGEKVSDQADAAKFLSSFFPLLGIPVVAAGAISVSRNVSE